MRKFLRIVLICIVLISAMYTIFALQQEDADYEVYGNVGQYITQETVPEKDVFGYQIQYYWEPLLSKNKDITGWIYIPDNEYINFPVVQGSNNSYYLNRDYTRKWNANGAAFVDYRCNKLCLNKIIYAHNMSRSIQKPMFTSIINWVDEDYFNSHRIVYYTEVNGMTKKYLIVGVCGFNVKSEQDFSYLDMTFETEEKFRDWIEYIRQHSLYFDLDGNDIDYRADEVMTLSTCDRTLGFGNNGRRVLFCINLTNNELDNKE